MYENDPGMYAWTQQAAFNPTPAYMSQPNSTNFFSSLTPEQSNAFRDFSNWQSGGQTNGATIRNPYDDHAWTSRKADTMHGAFSYSPQLQQGLKDTNHLMDVERGKFAGGFAQNTANNPVLRNMIGQYQMYGDRVDRQTPGIRPLVGSNLENTMSQWDKFAGKSLMNDGLRQETRMKDQMFDWVANTRDGRGPGFGNLANTPGRWANENQGASSANADSMGMRSSAIDNYNMAQQGYWNSAQPAPPRPNLDPHTGLPTGIGLHQGTGSNPFGFLGSQAGPAGWGGFVRDGNNRGSYEALPMGGYEMKNLPPTPFGSGERLAQAPQNYVPGFGSTNWGSGNSGWSTPEQGGSWIPPAQSAPVQPPTAGLTPAGKQMSDAAWANGANWSTGNQRQVNERQAAQNPLEGSAMLNIIPNGMDLLSGDVFGQDWQAAPKLPPANAGYPAGMAHLQPFNPPNIAQGFMYGSNFAPYLPAWINPAAYDPSLFR